MGEMDNRKWADQGVSPFRSFIKKVHVSWKQCREETWSYTALAGIVSFHVGIIVVVFASKGLLGDYDVNTAAEVIGIIISIGGIAMVVASGILYRRHRLHLRPCICCGDDVETVSVSRPQCRRLRFAPNLVSPYYQEAIKECAKGKAATGKSNGNRLAETYGSSESIQLTESTRGSPTPRAESGGKSPAHRKEKKNTLC